MKEILINVSKETRMVDLKKNFIGVDGENLQGKLVFTFIDEFVNGQGRLEYEIKGNKNYVVLVKENETYTIPVKNVITKEGQIDMQLVITEGTDEEEIPVFKSNKFYLYCNSSINAVDKAPEGYDLWIEQANVKLNQLDNIDIDLKDNVLTITKKDGTKISENVKGDPGVQGKPGSVKTIPVNEFPTENIQTDAIYILPNPDSKDEKDKYLEYVYINGDWELFGGGSVGIDLTNYYTKEEVDTVISNAGGDSPIIEAKLQNLTITATKNSYSLSDTDKVIIAEAITKAYANGDGYPLILLRTKGLFLFFVQSVTNITSKPTSWYLEGFSKTLVHSGQVSWGMTFVNAGISILGSWEGDVFACTSCSMSLDRPQYLSKTNTRSYTPTSDYNPATKKYVDNAIAQLKTELSGGA